MIGRAATVVEAADDKGGVDTVVIDVGEILGIADLFVINKADFAGENKLKRELLDISTGRDIFETVATKGQGIVELLDGLFV